MHAALPLPSIVPKHLDVQIGTFPKPNSSFPERDPLCSDQRPTGTGRFRIELAVSLVPYDTKKAC